MPASDAQPVVIAGAGYSGTRLAAALRAAGRQVTTLSRQARAEGDHIAWDADAGSPPALAAAQLVVLFPPAAGAPEPRLSALLRGLAALPERIVLASTSGVYGDCGGALVDENRPVAPATERARRRVIQEQTLTAWAEARGVRTLVLRVAGIYGPGRLPTARLDAGEPVIAEAEAYPGNRIHVDDLVRALAAAVAHPSAAGIFNVADGNHDSGTVFYRRVAALSGRPPPVEISRAEALATFPAQRYSFLAESRRLVTQRLREDLGVIPVYADLDAGIRASLAEEARASA